MRSKRCKPMAIAVVSLWVGAAVLSPAQAQDKAGKAGLGGPAGTVLESGLIHNIVEWDGGTLPAVYERSDQLPMTLDDVRKLSESKFSETSITNMLEQRRCACDASVDALVSLKEAGVSEAVIEAVSLHALRPNRFIDLTISLDFEGKGGMAEISTQARKGYLYLIIPDGERERVFVGNLQSILGRQWQRDTLIDNTDLLLRKKVRRILFASRVPLKVHGEKQALVFTSTKPDIYTSADIPKADREAAMEFAFNYPSSSLQQSCSLQALHRQDAMLADRWHLVRTHFECEWE